MMIELLQGNLLEADVEALVNSVNTVGVMGRGLALQFKQTHPDMFNAYRKACQGGELRPGAMHVYERADFLAPKYIINFPTKRHWREPARMEDIQTGLKALIQEIKTRGIRSIAVPALGCGQGGLPWDDVYALIRDAFAALPDVRVLVYAPGEAPVAAVASFKMQRPSMTPSRAVVLRTLQAYQVLDYPLTLLEIHKLLYFLQEAGEPLRLRYAQGHFGPYADNLRFVLQAFEGHFTQGFHDGADKPSTQIRVLPGAVEEAKQFLAANLANAGSQARLERVLELIHGYESPYGLELLSSVHWVCTHGTQSARDEQEVVQAIHNWNERKRRTMKPEHIRLAWQRLHEEGWLTQVTA